jgi:hypothetical protein
MNIENNKAKLVTKLFGCVKVYELPDSGLFDPGLNDFNVVMSCGEFEDKAGACPDRVNGNCHWYVSHYQRVESGRLTEETSQVFKTPGEAFEHAADWGSGRCYISDCGYRAMLLTGSDYTYCLKGIFYEAG